MGRDYSTARSVELFGWAPVSVGSGWRQGGRNSEESGRRALLYSLAVNWLEAANFFIWREQTAKPMGDREADRILVERVQAGDKQAFGLLVAKYQRKLARLISRMVRDSAEVEDIVQDSFIRAYRALPGFRNDSAFYTWLYRIGVNTAKNWLMTHGRRASATTGVDSEEAENYDDADLLRDHDTPERLLMTKQIGQVVNAAMEALPEDLRTAITLREIEGLSYEEIAQVMDCPIGTVRSRIFRARDAISAKLRPLLDAAPDKRW